jgi:hypothetical protein
MNAGAHTCALGLVVVISAAANTVARSRAVEECIHAGQACGEACVQAAVAGPRTTYTSVSAHVSKGRDAGETGRLSTGERTN